MSKRSKSPQLTSGWELWRHSFSEFRAGWKVYSLVILMISLPSRLLGLSSSLSSDGGFNAYATVAAVIMNLALLSAVRTRLDGDQPTLRSAYYDGTAGFVRYALVIAVLSLTLFPAVIGIVLFSAGTQNASSTGEIIVIGLLALLFFVPSVWLFIRYGLALIIVGTEAVRPVTALKEARRLTLGRFWLLVGRFVVLAFWLLLSAAIIVVLSELCGLLVHNTLFLDSLIGFLASLLLLPLGTIYLMKLVDALRQVDAA